MITYDSDKENAVAEIRSLQRLDDQTDRTELNSKAVYSYTKERITLLYPELDEDGDVCGTTMIAVLRPDLVTVQKTGFAESKMVLETGKTHLATYDMRFGAMDMALSAIDIASRLGPEGGTLHLHYLLDINGEANAENILEIRVKLL